MASSSTSRSTKNSSTRYLHRLKEHTAAVKALAWCPFQGNLLASGGGDGDDSIKFRETARGVRGACLNSVHTGSEVSALLWNKNEHELLSSHGFTGNQLTLWEYPSMLKITELTIALEFFSWLRAWMSYPLKKSLELEKTVLFMLKKFLELEEPPELHHCLDFSGDQLLFSYLYIVVTVGYPDID
ncbi:hypothetical protein CDL15_Pgr017455 [Punica granatum]|uniref:Anaphase-promoting complex subunit 4 WD40 domain-containing protein n=1 Tax=Punica granatum TaxID=22663 RepID=A0A218W5J9_PUNGR|nr:hypothetical protein CDL15_Pgr017455 [Punica granatum]